MNFRGESLGPKLELVLQTSLHAVPQHQSLILQEVGTAEQNGLVREGEYTACSPAV